MAYQTSQIEDYEDEDPENLEWRNQRREMPDPYDPSQESVEKSNKLQDDEDPNWKNPSRPTQALSETPEEFFLIPPHYNLEDVVEHEFLEQIGSRTGCFLKLSNDEKQKINMWGRKENLIEAKVQLRNRLLRIYETTQKDRRTNKWAKPERALTEKERKRQVRKRKDKEETDLYLKEKGPVDKPFIGVFIIPTNKFAIIRIVGFNEEKLNEIRMQSKCFIWYEPPPANIMKIAGDTKESVNRATARVKNLFRAFYLRPKRDDKPEVLYLLDQPSENFKIRFAQIPSGIETPSTPPAGCFYSIVEKLETGTEMSVNVVQDLIDLGEGELSGRLPTHRKDVKLPLQILTLNDMNANKLEEVMETALEKIRLFDYVIRMKIRFGQFYAKDYPKGNKDWSIPTIVNRYFPHENFVAELAPCIAKKEANIKPFEEFLDEYCPDRYTDSPSDTFVFKVHQQLEFFQPSKMNPTGFSRRDDTRITCNFKKDGHIGQWDVITDAGFKNDGHIGLWDCVTDEVKLMSAYMVNLDKNYAWELRLDAARRMRLDRPLPHGQFAHGLRLRKNKRLLYTNNNELEVKSITQKTKWLYYWTERDYVIEVCRDKIWDKKLPRTMDIDLEIDLAQEPNNQIYKISMYKEAWNNRFAMNLNLGIGMTPDWSARDFLHTTENAAQLISDAREFVDLLTKNLPRYWEQDVE